MRLRGRAAAAVLLLVPLALAACGEERQKGDPAAFSVSVDGAGAPMSDGETGTIGVTLNLTGTSPVTLTEVVVRGPLTPTADPTIDGAPALGQTVAPGTPVTLTVPVELACAVDDGVGVQVTYERADGTTGLLALTPIDVPGLEPVSSAAHDACRR